MNILELIAEHAVDEAVQAYRNAPIVMSGHERMKVAIAAYEAALIWPIADAPRDGTMFLTFDPTITTPWIHDHWDSEFNGWSVSPDSDPTHFRPAPPPPNIEK